VDTPPAAAVLSRLHLTIQRLVDADLLLEEEATELLAQVESAAVQAPDGADGTQAQAEALQPLIERLAPLIEALLTGGNLPAAALPEAMPPHHSPGSSAAVETFGAPIDDRTDRPGIDRAAS